MPSFPRPSFTHNYQVDIEINNLKNYQNTAPGRAIPAKDSNRLLIATWNIANLGLQDRNDNAYQLIAEMISWFDMIALQEVNDNLIGLRSITQNLPSSFKVIFSDKAGNNERLAFIYDTTSDKITPWRNLERLLYHQKITKLLNSRIFSKNIQVLIETLF